MRRHMGGCRRCTAEDLKKFDWQDFLDETAAESTLEEMMRQADSLLSTEEEEGKKKRAGRILVNEEAAQKIQQWHEDATAVGLEEIRAELISQIQAFLDAKNAN